MKRIAIIFEGRLHDRMGVFNAVMQRAKHLRDIAPIAIDIHMIEGYDRGLNRLLHGTRLITNRPDHVNIDGNDIVMHWFCHSLADTVRHKLLHRSARNYRKWLSHLADELSHYDLISAHDRIAATAAAMATARYGMPHYISWHGENIHTEPANDTVYRCATIEQLRGATCNFFVSRALERYARATLTNDMTSEILYNGASDEFRRLDDNTRCKLRHERGIDDCDRVVGFVGRMEPVKNVTLLPQLYSRITQLYDGRLKFVALGDGRLFNKVRQSMNKLGIDCLMPGAVPYNTMHEWMNCIDVLVLPSSKEGLPLVALEALACGINVVGTDNQCMGTVEAIGKDNAIVLNPHFIDNMAQRTVQMLQGGVIQALPPDMNWKATARREFAIYSAKLHINASHKNN